MSKELKINLEHPRFNDEFFGFKKIEEYFLEILRKKEYLMHIYFTGLKELENPLLHID